MTETQGQPAQAPEPPTRNPQPTFTPKAAEQAPTPEPEPQPEPSPAPAADPAPAVPSEPTTAEAVPADPQAGDAPDPADSQPGGVVTADGTHPSVLVRFRDVLAHVENFIARHPELRALLESDFKSGLATIEKHAPGTVTTTSTTENVS